MRVVVTGTAGCLARVLLPRLCAHAEVDSVLGIDIRQSGYRHPKFSEERLDVRSPQLAHRIAGADALIHAAFVVDRGGLGRGRFDRAAIRDINVGGSCNVLALARRLRIGRVVHLSSAAVYGPWPDLPLPVDETAPLRPLRGFAYAEDKAAVERWLDRHEDTAWIRLRVHVILGPNAQPLLLRLLHQPFCPRLPDPQPLLQCVWEDDVAEAVLLALLGRATGSFNIAADPPLSFRSLHRALHQQQLPLPLPLLAGAQRLAWRITGLGGEPGWLAGLRHSLVLSCERAQRGLGWRPRHPITERLPELARILAGGRRLASRPSPP